jgi:hypothetical protein
MFWVRTYRIVTFMKNLHSLWDRTIMKFPRKSMGFYKCRFSMWITNLPITRDLGCASPSPTAIGFNYIVPESFFKWYCGAKVFTFSTAKDSTPFTKMCRIDIEYFLTMFTSTLKLFGTNSVRVIHNHLRWLVSVRGARRPSTEDRGFGWPILAARLQYHILNFCQPERSLPCV